MAYTTEIIKLKVDQQTEDDFIASIRVVIKDEGVIVLDKPYSERYYSQCELDTIEQKLQEKFVTDWNKYKAEQAILKAAAFDTLVSNLQVAATTYVNS